ncbi:MAG: hypothetical protein U1E23_14900 [Reyranellaceae bacterium]
MTDAAYTPDAVAPHVPLTEIEVQRLSVWLQRTPLPAWREFTPALASTPPETIARLIAEWRAQRQIVDLVGEFAADLGQLIRRMDSPR